MTGFPVCDKCHTNQYGKVIWECWRCEHTSILLEIASILKRIEDMIEGRL